MKRSKMPSYQTKRLLEFIAEAGLLKRVQRSGWWVVGVKNPESVAEHSFRCAIIAYLIAKLENAKAPEALAMALFGDMHEARTNDLHKMAQRYVSFQKAEEDAFREQISSLPKAIKDELAAARKQYRLQKTKESIIARDADILECLIQAKEYCEHGFTQAAEFMKKAPRFLKTKTARALWKSAQRGSLSSWWQGLSDFGR